MNHPTGELVNALNAVSQHIPRVVTDLLTESLSSAKQHEFADLLVELGELLHQHAGDFGVPGTIDTPTAPDWLMLESKHGADDPTGT